MVQPQQRQSRETAYAAPREWVIYPLEVLVRCAYLLFGRVTPAGLRGGLITALILSVSWLLASGLFDYLVNPGTRYPVLGPMIEIIGWGAGLAYATRRYGNKRRLWQTWLAIAGVSNLVWLFSIVMLWIGIGPLLVALIGFALGVRGYGEILYAAFGRQRADQYFTAGAWMFCLGMIPQILRAIIA